MSMWSAPFSEANPTGEFCSVAISVNSEASRLPNFSSSSATLAQASCCASLYSSPVNCSTLAAKIAASTGVSAARNGRSAGLGSVCPIALKCSEQFQDQHDGGCDYEPFENDVVAPVSWKR